MSYALGLELAPDAVRAATMSEATAYDGPFEVHPPVLLCSGGQTWFGATAVAHGASRPNALVNDVVGQFTVDRVFLTEGRMLTPDDALRELLWGIVSDLGARRGELPAAVSIVCPAGWDAPTRGRVEAIAYALGFASVRLPPATDAYQAAADAYTRIAPVAAPTEAPTEVPLLESQFKRARPPRDAPIEVVPQPTTLGSSRRAIVGSLVAVILIIGALTFVLVRNARTSNPATGPAPTTTGAVLVTPFPLSPRGAR